MKYEEVIETFGGGACLKKVVLSREMQPLKGTSGPSPFGNPCIVATMQRTVLHQTAPDPQQLSHGHAQGLLELLVSISLQIYFFLRYFCHSNRKVTRISPWRSLKRITAPTVTLAAALNTKQGFLDHAS